MTQRRCLEEQTFVLSLSILQVSAAFSVDCYSAWLAAITVALADLGNMR